MPPTHPPPSLELVGCHPRRPCFASCRASCPPPHQSDWSHWVAGHHPHLHAPSSGADHDGPTPPPPELSTPLDELATSGGKAPEFGPRPVPPAHIAWKSAPPSPSSLAAPTLPSDTAPSIVPHHILGANIAMFTFHDIVVASSMLSMALVDAKPLCYCPRA